MLTIGQMNQEIMKRIQQYGLTIDCGIDGSTDATVAIIAEAPGDRERVLKMPLVGGSGKVLWDTVRKYGINRRNTYITNVVKKQLLGSGDTKERVDDGDFANYSAILQWELSQLPNLKYILCLGNFALQAITGYKGINTYRGSVFPVQLRQAYNDKEVVTRDVQVLATYNPAAVLRNPSNELMFKFDMGRLNELVTGKFEQRDVEAIINPTFGEAMAYIEKMRQSPNPVGLDIETSSGETICIGLSDNIYNAMCINFRDANSNRFTVKQEMQLWVAIQRLVKDPNVRLVMQNGMYDASWLWFKDRVKITSFWFDTMLAHHTLYPTLPHNLGFLVSQYTNHPFYKDEGKIWKETGDIDAEWRYNAKDVCLMLEAQQKMLKELEAQQMDEFFFSHVMTVQPHLVDMTVHGVKIDTDLKEKIVVDMRAKIKVMKEQYYDMVASATGDPDYRPNPNSPKQMAELFFKRLKLVGRGQATDKENRRRMRDHPRTPDDCVALLNHIDELAEEQKFVSTYAEMSIDDDGRVRCEYKQMGVVKAPGRLSSSSTGWGTGSNLQNQPARSHEMFVADEGYEFSYFDLSQAEARVVGWLAPIPSWISDFERARTEGGFDCHRSLAAQMFNMDYNDTPTEDIGPDGKHTKRYIAKRCRHGLNYRMMPDRLATTLHVPYAEAEYLWHLYHKINPELQEWWNKTVAEVKANRSLFTPYGRRWILLEQFSDEATESIIAFRPQSTIGDKVTRIIRLCHSDPDWPRGLARVALNIHDALIALNHISVGPVVRAIMKKHAEEPIIIKGYDGVERELIIPADLKVSVPDEHGTHRWSNMQKVK